MCEGANYCSVCWPKSTELSMAVYRQVQGCDCSWCRSSRIVMISEQASSQVSAGDCSCYISGSIGRSLHYSLCQHSCKMIQLHKVYKAVRHMVIRQATRPRYQYICLATKRLPTCTSFRVICMSIAISIWAIKTVQIRRLWRQCRRDRIKGNMELCLAYLLEDQCIIFARQQIQIWYSVFDPLRVVCFLRAWKRGTWMQINE